MDNLASLFTDSRYDGWLGVITSFFDTFETWQSFALVNKYCLDKMRRSYKFTETSSAENGSKVIIKRLGICSMRIVYTLPENTVLLLTCYANKKAHGRLVGHDRNTEQITEEYTYKWGQKEGPTIAWHPRIYGQSLPIIKFIRLYKDDKLEGEYKEWDTNGVLRLQIQYTQGEIGETKSWNANGQLIQQ